VECSVTTEIIRATEAFQVGHVAASSATLISNAALLNGLLERVGGGKAGSCLHRAFKHVAATDLVLANGGDQLGKTLTANSEVRFSWLRNNQEADQ
jgi:hypothetical protein